MSAEPEPHETDEIDSGDAPARPSPWPFVLGGGLAVSLALSGAVWLARLAQERDLAAARGEVREARAQLQELEERQRGATTRAAGAGRAEGEAELSRQLEELAGKEREAKEALAGREAQVQAAEKRLAEVERALAAQRGEQGARWRELRAEVEPSLLLIEVALRGRAPGGAAVELVSYGTGFFVGSQGHVVTAKHLVEPWKFRELAFRIARERIEVDPHGYRLRAWRAQAGGAGPGPATGPATGLGEPAWSSAAGTLALLRTAPDVWLSLMPGDPVRAVMIHDPRQGDLALLQVRGPGVRPIAAGRGGEGEVLVLGYPAGSAPPTTAVPEGALGALKRGPAGLGVEGAALQDYSGAPLVDARGRAVGVCTGVGPKGVEGVDIEQALRLVFGGTW